MYFVGRWYGPKINKHKKQLSQDLSNSTLRRALALYPSQVGSLAPNLSPEPHQMCTLSVEPEVNSEYHCLVNSEYHWLCPLNEIQPKPNLSPAPPEGPVGPNLGTLSKIYVTGLSRSRWRKSLGFRLSGETNVFFQCLPYALVLLSERPTGGLGQAPRMIVWAVPYLGCPGSSLKIHNLATLHKAQPNVSQTSSCPGPFYAR